MPKSKKKNNFENDLKRLEQISNLLESNEIGLDDAIALFEEGIKLSKICINKLNDAELKITELKKELSEVSSGK
jgi:exodeoxyribonuclease VII small subunit